jgi:hypothetical protein
MYNSLLHLCIYGGVICIFLPHVSGPSMGSGRMGDDTGPKKIWGP